MAADMQSKRHFGQRFVESMRGTQLSLCANPQEAVLPSHRRPIHNQRRRANLSLAGYAPFSPYEGRERSPDAYIHLAPPPAVAAVTVEAAPRSGSVSRNGTPTRMRPCLVSSLANADGYLTLQPHVRERSPRRAVRLAPHLKNEQSDPPNGMQARGRKHFHDHVARTVSPTVRVAFGSVEPPAAVAAASPTCVAPLPPAPQRDLSVDRGRRKIRVDHRRSPCLDAFGDPDEGVAVKRRVPEPMIKKPLRTALRLVGCSARDTADLISMGTDVPPPQRPPNPPEPYHQVQGKQQQLGSKRHYGGNDLFHVRHFAIGSTGGNSSEQSGGGGDGAAAPASRRRSITPRGRGYDILSQDGVSDLSPPRRAMRVRQVAEPPDPRSRQPSPARQHVSNTSSANILAWD